ncbi:phenylalanine--tRNA ligase subunit beta [Desulfotruncus alcoholivorax]|uniref:phenylalanine--tRNA ligase subunit beta n=1 Tax=Desulfotruncus alcoholivorax TaxID=265477 RepID=UPI000412E625|nr:phenylalanine--tRNA ligase subunit beta [Desulfotruncus alcoholivorax]
MRVSYKWLKEYVQIDVPPRELAERLTLAGVAVEAIEEPGKDISNVYTGKILKIEQHPNADKLVVCRVTTGGDEELQIVTGATNVREGHIIPVAVVGARLTGGLTIKKAKLRGVESRGMLCSGQELGLDPDTMPEDQAHGIMILPADTPLGVDVKPLIGLDDAILELELTPNRGDCMSMVGVAREVAAIFNKPFKMPETDVAPTVDAAGNNVKVDIEDPALCRRYVARLLKNVKIGASPAWMQERLRAAGVRPINNVVDVTNYVMMELGQPLHAFDYNKLKDGHIIVRRAADDEAMLTLDKSKRELSSDMLVITDPGGPVAVAGVMGGYDSEVTPETKAILLESAYFDPVSIRRTSRDLGLRSESSARFEKGIDLTGCRRAADRAARLLVDMGAAEVVDLVVDNYPRPWIEKTILLRPQRVYHILDLQIPQPEIADLLIRLQFQVKEDEKGLLVTVPGFRPDISLEIDLIEEVARLYGFNCVPNTLPVGSVTQGARNYSQELALKIRNFLATGGFSEVITYTFVNPRVFDLLGLAPDSQLRKTVALKNPMSEDQSVMRTLLYPGLLDVLQRNAKRQVKDAAVFELGRVYHPREGETLPLEVTTLAAAVTGSTPGGWNRSPVTMDFYYLKGVLDALLVQVGVNDVSYVPVTGAPGFHPGRTAAVICGETEIGIIGDLHPDVQEAYDLSRPVTIFEVNFDKLAGVSGNLRRYKSLPRFPGVERDLAVVIRNDIPCADIINTICRAASALLQEVRLFDVYRGKQVEKGRQSLAFSLKFQAADRTLTDDEVNKQIEKITGALEREYAAVLRS